MADATEQREALELHKERGVMSKLAGNESTVIVVAFLVIAQKHRELRRAVSKSE